MSVLNTILFTLLIVANCSFALLLAGIAAYQYGVGKRLREGGKEKKGLARVLLVAAAVLALLPILCLITVD
jgi:hypothetical protein